MSETLESVASDGSIIGIIAAVIVFGGLGYGLYRLGVFGNVGKMSRKLKEDVTEIVDKVNDRV